MANPIVRNFNRFFVCGIDGTVDHFKGIAKDLEANQRDYDTKFAKSFVRQLCNGGLPSLYLRGPAATGSGLGYAMGKATDTIALRYNQDLSAYKKSKSELHDPTLRGYILTGYSRGAAGIIEVATRLVDDIEYKKLGIRIYAMILFDTVNETNTSVQGVINRGEIKGVTVAGATVAAGVVGGPGTAVGVGGTIGSVMPNYSNPESIILGDLRIPTNVANCVHYIRSDESNSRSTTMAKYRGGPVNNTNTRYTPLYLKATHGGLGGLPYFQGTGEGNNIPILEPGAAFPTNVTMAEDIKGSRDVAKHVNTFCGALHIPLAITV